MDTTISSRLQKKMKGKTWDWPHRHCEWTKRFKLDAGWRTDSGFYSYAWVRYQVFWSLIWKSGIWVGTLEQLAFFPLRHLRYLWVKLHGIYWRYFVLKSTGALPYGLWICDDRILVCRSDTALQGRMCLTAYAAAAGTVANKQLCNQYGLVFTGLPYLTQSRRL